MDKTLQGLEERYDLELEKVVGEIKSKKAKLVLLQFPDGLKPYATAVVDFLRDKTGAGFLIWFGSCFGACDTPILGTAQCTPNCGMKGHKDLEKKVDLVIQFGHNELLSDY